MNNKSKVEIIARITTPDGRVIEESSVVDDRIPDPDEFDLCSREGFLRDFDDLETGIVSARDEAMRKVTKSYMDETSKKNALKAPKGKHP